MKAHGSQNWATFSPHLHVLAVQMPCLKCWKCQYDPHTMPYIRLNPRDLGCWTLIFNSSHCNRWQPWRPMHWKDFIVTSEIYFDMLLISRCTASEMREDQSSGTQCAARIDIHLALSRSRLWKSREWMVSYRGIRYDVHTWKGLKSFEVTVFPDLRYCLGIQRGMKNQNNTYRLKK